MGRPKEGIQTELRRSECHLGPLNSQFSLEDLPHIVAHPPSEGAVRSRCPMVHQLVRHSPQFMGRNGMSCLQSWIIAIVKPADLETVVP